MLLIADSSALIALAVCDSLELLESLYQEIKVPKAVFEEVTTGNRAYCRELTEFLEGKTISLPEEVKKIQDFSLGAGETEAMILYKKLPGDLLLVDDKRAKKIAALNNINTIGSLGVWLEAKLRHLVPEIRTRMIKLHQSDVFIQQQLYNAVLKKVGEEPI